jgi:predicted RNA methylase
MKRRKQLVWQLESLQTFDDPKLHLEQYATSAEMAVEILEAVDGDVGLKEKIVADFGCGPGILMICSAMLGAQKCRGFELDEATAEICRQNIEEAEVDDTCTVEVKNVSFRMFMN